MNRREFLSVTAAPVLAATAATGVRVTAIDEIPVGPALPPVFFVSPFTFIRVQWRGPASLHAVALTRRRDGPWMVAAGRASRPSAVGAGGYETSIPISLGGPNVRQMVMVCLAADPPPAGTVMEGARWGQVIDRTEPVTVSSETFDRARLQVIGIGGRVPTPGVAEPVADYEEVAIRAQGLPAQSVVHVVIEPTNNSRYWISDRHEVARDSVIHANGFFGRLDADTSAKRERDVHAQFWISSVASTVPLPVRPSGITAGDWLRLERFIKVASPKVSVVRAILPDQIRLRVTRLGHSNDGFLWLAPRFSRVEGTFTAGVRYRPRALEVITLLVRSAESNVWSIAGATNLSTNRAVWTIPVADLLPANGNPERDSMVAVAVASYLPFDRDARRVTAVDIDARKIAISNEVAYRLMVHGRRP